MKDTEVEITFPLHNPKELAEKLKTLSAVPKGEQYQKDTYFNPLCKDFLKERPISDWLRIRETKNGASVNFKHWHNQGNTQAVSCDEFESVIGNPDALHNILDQLEIKELVVVEKKRTIWDYREVEIAIDEVKNLGIFIELEAKGNFSSIDDGKDHLYQVLKELEAQTGEQDYRGYPHLMLERLGYKL